MFIIHPYIMNEAFALKNYTVMPVPTAFNDLAASHSIRDHLGWVWYQYRYLSPLLLSSDKQIVLHLESVNYACFVVICRPN
jgi:beta-glucuronidase